MKVPLTGGFYQAQSLIADAQRCVNLYPERNPEDSPFPFTTYPTAGLTILAQAPAGGWRCLYRASTGDLYGVAGQTVYFIDRNWQLNTLGTIASVESIVVMKDNRLVIIVVDGTSAGYYIDLENNMAFGSFQSAAFYGANFVDLRDTFFLFNQPATANWYISASNMNAAQILGGPLETGTIAGGAGYPNGSFTAIPLSGGTGSGAIADIVTSGGAVISVDPTVMGDEYQVGDVLTVDPSLLGGALVNFGDATNGSGYVNGTYNNVALTGGSGSGATATLLVSSGGVTLTTITKQGVGYLVNDVLSAPASALGGTGGGYSITVTTVSGSGAGFTYTLTAVDTGGNAFNPLDIAAKATDSDTLATLRAVNQQIWLIGQRTTEPWYDAGTPDFVFGRLPGPFVEHGTLAPYSVIKADDAVIWLSQDKDGDAIFLMAQGYSAKRISTHAIEKVISGYPNLGDCVGLTYQQRGHTFCQWNFPAADATWVYDMTTGMWHEKTWTDQNGIEHRHRAQVSAFAYRVNVVGDWQNGNLYQLDETVFTDYGGPIVCRRGFPHIVNEGRNLSYDRFIAEMDTGESLGTSDAQTQYIAIEAATTGPQAIQGVVSPLQAILGEIKYGDQPGVSLRWSDSRGRRFGNPIFMPIGAQGEFAHSVQARNLGLGRDRVFELFWNSAEISFTALNGAYVDATPAET